MYRKDMDNYRTIGPSITGPPPQIPTQEPAETIPTPSRIIRHIEVSHPEIINSLISYGVPADVARTIIRRIIGITITQF